MNDEGCSSKRVWRRVEDAAMALFLALSAHGAVAQASGALATAALPPEVRPFVLPGTKAIGLERGDLNGDGRIDVVLVLELQKSRPGDDEIREGQRPILILARQSDGTLVLAARNNAAAHCSTCGGVMGDPFMGIVVGSKTLTVSNYGGSGWRWSADYRFDYSRRDEAWQLVRVTESSFHASDPNTAKTTVRRPPKDFGKIGFADFDPKALQDRGRR